MGTQDEFIRLGAQANQRRANSKNDQNSYIQIRDRDRSVARYLV